MKIIYTSTKSKKKPNKKPGWQKAEAEYAAWCLKHGVGTSSKKSKFVPYTSSEKIYRRETPVYPSLNTGTGSCALAPKKVYTGNKIVGIAAMHKSNLVPIFNDEAAKDVASMRR